MHLDYEKHPTLACYYVMRLSSKPNPNKLGADESGYRKKAVFTKRPQDPYDPLLEKLYKIRPYRRIEESDLIL